MEAWRALVACAPLLACTSAGGDPRPAAMRTVGTVQPVAEVLRDETRPSPARPLSLDGEPLEGDALAGCPATPPGPRDDDTLATEVRDAIHRDRSARWARVDVSVHAGTVLLRGSADSSHQREVLRREAAGVPGVADVILAVEVPAAYRRDPEIASQVRRRLDGDPRVDSARVRVDVNAGTVSLSGTQSNLFERDAAVADAWSSGAASVDAHALRVDWAATVRSAPAETPRVR